MGCYNLFGFNKKGQDLIPHGPPDTYGAQGNYECWARMDGLLRKYGTKMVKLRTQVVAQEWVNSVQSFSKKEIRTYLELLTAFFPGYRFGLDKMANMLKEDCSWDVSLKYPAIVGFGAATIVRFLAEKPNTVRYYLELREALPKVPKWKIYLICHAAGIDHNAFHAGHSLIQAHGQNFKIIENLTPKDILDQWFEFDPKNKLPANVQKIFTGMLNDNYEKLILNQVLINAKPISKEQRIEKAKELLGL